MLTPGPSRTATFAAFASAPSASPSARASSTFHVHASATAGGKHVAGMLPPMSNGSPSSGCLRRPCGPSETMIRGIPASGTGSVCQKSLPEVSAAFCSSVSVCVAMARDNMRLCRREQPSKWNLRPRHCVARLPRVRRRRRAERPRPRHGGLLAARAADDDGRRQPRRRVQARGLARRVPRRRAGRSRRLQRRSRRRRRLRDAGDATRRSALALGQRLRRDLRRGTRCDRRSSLGSRRSPTRPRAGRIATTSTSPGSSTAPRIRR